MEAGPCIELESLRLIGPIARPRIRRVYDAIRLALQVRACGRIARSG